VILKGQDRDLNKLMAQYDAINDRPTSDDTIREFNVVPNLSVLLLINKNQKLSLG